MGFSPVGFPKRKDQFHDRDPRDLRDVKGGPLADIALAIQIVGDDGFRDIEHPGEVGLAEPGLFHVFLERVNVCHCYT